MHSKPRNKGMATGLLVRWFLASGRSCMRQLLDFYKFATDHTASRPDFWSCLVDRSCSACSASGFNFAA